MIPQFEAGNFSVGTLVGLLLGAFIGHALAIRRGKIQSRHSAAIDLKKEFRPISLQLKNGDNPSFIISADVFHRLKAAALDYSATLEGKNLNMFNAALNEFSEWFGMACNRRRSERLYESDDPDYLRVIGKDPLKLIEKMLQYANT